MIRSLLLAALLVASFAAAERGVEPDMGPFRDGQLVTVPTGPRTPPSEPGSSYPQDGAFVYREDARCTTGNRAMPNLATALCMRNKALEYLIREVSERRVIPGPAFVACNSWAPYAFPACVDWWVRLHTPEIRFALSPVYVEGHIGGVPYVGCAAGVSYPTYARVSIADLPRSYRLAAWETANGIVVYWLDLRESGDGPIVSAATNYAATACGI